MAMMKHFIKSWSDKKNDKCKHCTNTGRRNIWMSTTYFLLREFGNLGILAVGCGYFGKLFHICTRKESTHSLHFRWVIGINIPGLSENKRDWSRDGPEALFLSSVLPHLGPLFPIITTSTFLISFFTSCVWSILILSIWSILTIKNLDFESWCSHWLTRHTSTNP